jgi:ribosomal protein L11 methyltransferase
MDTFGWTIRFKGYLPIDHRMEDRLRRVMANIGDVPDSAIEIDEAARVVTIDYGQVKGWLEEARTIPKALRVGERIVVRPPWEAYDATDGDVVIVIDAGPVFGSGLHETTVLCLEALEKYIRPGCLALDFGTGSGILAIAAAKLGASRVVAVEADPEAVQIARDNVARNGVEDAVTVFESLTPEVHATKVDVVTANIVPGTIISNLTPLSRVTADGAILIVSGLTTRTSLQVEEALPGAGFELVDKATKGEWVALAAKSAH